MSSIVFVLMSIVFMALYFGELHGIQPTAGAIVCIVVAFVIAVLYDIRRLD